MFFVEYRKLLTFFMLIFTSMIFVSCTPVGTQIYIADTNGVVDYFDEYYIELSDTTFSDDASWIEYEFLFSLKEPIDKKIKIEVRSFVLREGSERLGFNAPYLNCNIASTEGDFLSVAIDNEGVDQIYRSFSFGTDYIITITIYLDTLATAYDSFDYTFSQISSSDNAIALDIYGREIIFGVDGLI